MRSPSLPSIAIIAVVLGTLAACGGSDAPSAGDPADGVAGDTSGDAVGEPVEGETADSNTDPYNTTRSELESFDELTTSGGARIIVGADCDPQTGANLLRVAGTGLTGGPYPAVIEPSVGGRPDLNVQPDGTVYSARQTTLDAATYTVTYADLDGGISFTFEGCPA